MEEQNKTENYGIRQWQEKLLSRSIRRTQKISKITNLFGSTIGMQYLEISNGDSVISRQLYALGGHWKTIAVHENVAKYLTHETGEAVDFIKDEKLPFESGMFDRVVVIDVLKEIENDSDFIRECHRVLKPSGEVLVSENYRRPASLTALVQRLLSRAPISQGAYRNGYTEHELYQILKDGFDVPESVLYSNDLLECVATIAELFQNQNKYGPYWLARESKGTADIQRYKQLYTLAGISYPLMWFLSKLESLSSHRLLVKSRRRVWRPRIQPKLVDGRSIAEAAINTRIGSAAPF